jgi:hypothetical protein
LSSTNKQVAEIWPEIPFAAWSETCATLHMWTQVVGKIRLAVTPRVNHWWNVPLYVTATGLTTSPMLFGNTAFEIQFDFIQHHLVIRTSEGRSDIMLLAPRTVAEFYDVLMTKLRSLGIEIRIWPKPVEVADAIPFDQDTSHASYDAAHARRFWHALLQADRVLQQFRARFIGKASPVHFFWGSFDLAATRFSGRPAPPHPGGVPNLADWAVREAYSHECSSCGFWPGNGGFGQAAFYSYAYPEPAGFSDADAGVPGGYYSSELREFVLPYDAVRSARAPDALLLHFLQNTYDAAANLGKWDRDALERRQATGSPCR